MLPSGDPKTLQFPPAYSRPDGGAARIAAVAVGILHYDRVMDGYGWLSVVVIVITEPEQRTK